eukprot:Skav222572  [mRNA]  locus=scaffold791:237136:246432:+ [translate_table: standard]
MNRTFSNFFHFLHGSGAAAIALDKPKAAPKTSWSSGVTLAQRLRAEAAAQDEGTVDVPDDTVPTKSWVITLQAAVANTVLEDLLRRESWSFEENFEAHSHLALLAERLPLHSPLGFQLPFPWSSFLALDIDGGPKRRSRRGQSDAVERLRHNMPRLFPFYLTLVFALVILHSLSHFGIVMWIFVGQTALLLLPSGQLPNFKATAHVQVALLVGHAYSVSEVVKDE